MGNQIFKRRKAKQLVELIDDLVLLRIVMSQRKMFGDDYKSVERDAEKIKGFMVDLLATPTPKQEDTSNG